MASNYLIAHLKSHPQVGMSHPSSQQPSQNIYHGKSWYKTNSTILLCVGDSSANSSPMLYQIQRQIGEIPTWLDCRPCSVTVPNPSRGWWPSSFAAMLRGDESRVCSVEFFRKYIPFVIFGDEKEEWQRQGVASCRRFWLNSFVVKSLSSPILLKLPGPIVD